MENRRVPLFILTRFAQYYPPEIRPAPSEVWLSERLSILCEYTFPSVKRQTDQDFTWLLLVNEEIGEEWREKIERATSPYGKVILQNGFAPAGESFRNYLQNLEGELITVRFDSDDILHPEFISRVRSANLQRGDILSFVKGAVYDPHSRRSGIFKNHRNSFLSFRDSPDRNIFMLGPHSYMKSDDTKTMRTVMTKEPMWLQIVHGGNWKNWFRNYARPVKSQYIASVLHEPKLAGTAPFMVATKDWARFLTTVSKRVASSYFRKIARRVFPAK